MIERPRPSHAACKVATVTIFARCDVATARHRPTLEDRGWQWAKAPAIHSIIVAPLRVSAWCGFRQLVGPTRKAGYGSCSCRG